VNLRRSLTDAQKSWHLERCTDEEDLMLSLCDFFNQRGDLYEAVKTVTSAGPEGKKFLLAVDVSESQSAEIAITMEEMTHLCPSLHIVMSTELATVPKTRVIKVEKLTDKQIVDILEL